MSRFLRRDLAGCCLFHRSTQLLIFRADPVPLSLALRLDRDQHVDPGLQTPKRAVTSTYYLPITLAHQPSRKHMREGADYGFIPADVYRSLFFVAADYTLAAIVAASFLR
jgi:hypothetical protein